MKPSARAIIKINKTLVCLNYHGALEILNCMNNKTLYQRKLFTSEVIVTVVRNVGEMAQLVKCLTCRQDLSSNHSTQVKRTAVDRWILGMLLANLAESASSGFNEPLYQNTRCRRIEEDTNIHLLPPPRVSVHANTYTKPLVLSVIYENILISSILAYFPLMSTGLPLERGFKMILGHFECSPYF